MNVEVEATIHHIEQNEAMWVAHQLHCIHLPSDQCQYRLETCGFIKIMDDGRIKGQSRYKINCKHFHPNRKRIGFGIGP